VTRSSPDGVHGGITSLSAVAILTIAGIVGANLLRSSSSDASAAVRQGPDCVELDREATQALAPLLHDNSAAAEWKLDQALLQLRRARKHCRSGSVELAGHDYNSLVQSFPILTGSTKPKPGDLDLSARRIDAK
jgi:hypothetical protein